MAALIVIVIGLTFLPQTARTLHGALTAVVRGWTSRPLRFQVVVALLLAAALLTRRERAEPDAKDQARTWFLTPGEWRFVCLVILPCLVYLLLFRPDLGMARDWDLFAMLSLVFIPWGLLVVSRYLRTLPKEAWRLVPAIAMTIVLSGAWIGIHTSWARSVDRFEAILASERALAQDPPWAWCRGSRHSYGRFGGCSRFGREGRQGSTRLSRGRSMLCPNRTRRRQDFGE